MAVESDVHAAKKSGASDGCAAAVAAAACDCQTIGFAPTRVVLQEIRKATNDLALSLFNAPNVENRTRYFGVNFAAN